MTKTENAIIAEFMGHHKDAVGLYLIPEMASGRHSQLFREDQVLYSISWDWLMPVVEKIAKMHSEKFHYDPVEIAKGVFPEDNNYIDVICLPVSTPISQVHKAVVDFIKTLTP